MLVGADHLLRKRIENMCMMGAHVDFYREVVSSLPECIKMSQSEHDKKDKAIKEAKAAKAAAEAERAREKKEEKKHGKGGG